MESPVPFEDCNRAIKHDTGRQQVGERWLAHRYTELARTIMPCGDHVIYAECSCGLTLTAVVSRGGCGEAHHAVKDAMVMDTFHRNLLLLDSSQQVEVDVDGVLRDRSLVS